MSLIWLPAYHPRQAPHTDVTPTSIVLCNKQALTQSSPYWKTRYLTWALLLNLKIHIRQLNESYVVHRVWWVTNMHQKLIWIGDVDLSCLLFIIIKGITSKACNKIQFDIFVISYEIVSKRIIMYRGHWQ